MGGTGWGVRDGEYGMGSTGWGVRDGEYGMGGTGWGVRDGEYGMGVRDEGYGPSHVSRGSKSVIVIKMDHSCDSQKAVPVLAEGRDSQKDVTVKRP